MLGDWFQTITLLGFVYITTNSALMISLTLLSRSLPALILSPFAGVLVDRWNRKTIMIITDIIRAVIVLFLLLANHFIWIIFIVNVLLSVSGIFFTPARQAAIPTVVKEEELTTANALSSTTWGLLSIVGASLGGITSAFFGYSISFIINSASFLISAYFIYSARIPSIREKQNQRPTFIENIMEGYRFIVKTPIILALILVGMSWGVIGGAYQILLTVYGTDVFHGGNSGIGILYGIQGAGIIIGGYFVTKFIGNHETRMKNAFGWSYLLQGLFFILFILSTKLITGGIFLLLMRIAGGFIIPLDSTLIQKHTPEQLRGRVFSLHSSVYGAIIQLSMFLTGILLEWFTPQQIGVVFGSLCFVVSFIWLFMLYTNRLNEG